MSLKKHSICIRVPKVFDWVTRQIDLPTISFREPELSNLFSCTQTPTPAVDLCTFLANYPNFSSHCRVLEDSLFTQEVFQSGGRSEVEVSLGDGKDITLEKVKVLAKGLLEVDILDQNGNVICTSDPIEFATIQTFYLCAPEGTVVEAFISHGECDSEIVCTGTFDQLDISLTFCLDVHVVADVKLEVEAAYCKPRKELPVADVICKTDKFPPQCPLVFPGKH
ncbi:hypothetical protein M3212_13970 [Alkalihalobacillus oceani]|uniref:hypothetical protein n=1 Tax=Halalkalibacter oceani TaxID=1653776 RepID=UPI00203AC3A4|nr:hypothetical protein [Halalkalibacter oceani]MCM3761878.1 hypothetical protein [Halalkalibacter oceani]